MREIRVVVVTHEPGQWMTERFVIRRTLCGFTTYVGLVTRIDRGGDDTWLDKKGEHLYDIPPCSMDI